MLYNIRKRLSKIRTVIKEVYWNQNRNCVAEVIDVLNGHKREFLTVLTRVSDCPVTDQITKFERRQDLLTVTFNSLIARDVDGRETEQIVPL